MSRADRGRRGRSGPSTGRRGPGCGLLQAAEGGKRTRWELQRPGRWASIGLGRSETDGSGQAEGRLNKDAQWLRGRKDSIQKRLYMANQAMRPSSQC